MKNEENPIEIIPLTFVKFIEGVFMKNSILSSASTHVVWLDVVRFVAMFTVVCCHSADPFNFYVGEPPLNIGEIKFWGAAYGALLRPCVPLFVMLTGALLLPVRSETSVFYKKIR